MDAILEMKVLTEIDELFAESPHIIEGVKQDELTNYMLAIGEEVMLEAEDRDLNRGQMALAVIFVAHSILDPESPLNDPKDGVFK